MSFAAVAILSLLAAPRQEITFATSPLKQGQKVTVKASSEAAIAMSVKLGGQEIQKVDMTPKQDVAVVATVTEADDQGPTTAKLAFAKCAMVANTPLGPQEIELACSAQNYDVKRGEAGFAAVPDLEGEAKPLVEQICGSTLTSPLATVLAGKTLKKGEAIELTAVDAKKALGIFSSDFDVKTMKLTLDGERKEGGVDAAVFKIETTMGRKASDESPADMDLDMKGELVVARGAMIPVAASLTGPVKMSGSMDQGGQKIEMAGDGTMTWTYAAAIE